MGRAAILAGFDAAEFAGVTLFSRSGGSSVAAPALASMHDGGHYPDALALLNGYGSHLSLSTYAATVWTGLGGSGTMSMGIDSDGLCYLHCTAAEEFTVTGDLDVNGVYPFGFTASTVSVASGSGHRATATQRWARGNIDIRSSTGELGITRTLGGLASFPRRNLHHSLSTALTTAGGADFDAVTATLESWDNAANDSTNKRIRWGMDSEGRVWTAHESTLGSRAISWSSTAFRNALGFTGSETNALASGTYRMTATYPARGVLILRQGLAALSGARAWHGAGGNTLGGRTYGRVHSVTSDLVVEAILKGGMGLTDATSPYADEEQIYLERVAPYLGIGARVTVLPEWGDPRIGYSMNRQFQDGLTPVLHSATLRGDVGGVMGRRRCEVSTDTATEHLASFQPGPRAFTAPFQWRLRLIPDV